MIKADDMTWALNMLIRFGKRRNLSGINMTRDCLRKFKYKKALDYRKLVKKILILISDEGLNVYKKNAAICFLKNVDVSFLEYFLLELSKKDRVGVLFFIPTKELRKILKRLDEEFLLIDLLKTLSSKEVRGFFAIYSDLDINI